MTWREFANLWFWLTLGTATVWAIMWVFTSAIDASFCESVGTRYHATSLTFEGFCLYGDAIVPAADLWEARQ